MSFDVKKNSQKPENERVLFMKKKLGKFIACDKPNGFSYAYGFRYTRAMGFLCPMLLVGSVGKSIIAGIINSKTH